MGKKLLKRYLIKWRREEGVQLRVIKRERTAGFYPEVEWRTNFRIFREQKGKEDLNSWLALCGVMGVKTWKLKPEIEMNRDSGVTWDLPYGKRLIMMIPNLIIYDPLKNEGAVSFTACRDICQNGVIRRRRKFLLITFDRWPHVCSPRPRARLHHKISMFALWKHHLISESNALSWFSITHHRNMHSNDDSLTANKFIRHVSPQFSSGKFLFNFLFSLAGIMYSITVCRTSLVSVRNLSFR